MNENEAIEWIESLRDSEDLQEFYYQDIFIESLDMAIQALEKQIPKKPITHSNTNRADCPCCGATVRGIKNPFGDWCSNCGQKLDWSDLISRSELLKSINEEAKKIPIDAEKYHIDANVIDGMNATLKAITNIINEQPTAYDVDKVVDNDKF